MKYIKNEVDKFISKWSECTSCGDMVHEKRRVPLTQICDDCWKSDSNVC
jgi:formylmethanofuran dehydrogenase subunit E